MRRLIVTRLVWMVPTFLVITAITFAVAHLAPGDPLQLSEEGASAAAVEAARKELELDRPLVARYFVWLGRLATADLGRSVVDRSLVTEKIGDALPRTVLVSGLALVVATLLAIALGVLLAVRETKATRAVGAVLALASGVPSFWVAVLALLWLATPRGVELFPFQGLSSEGGGGLDLAWHLVLPVACLAWPTVAMLARYVREGVSSALRQEFVRAARARGLDERTVVLRHALPNALIPVVTVLGLHLPHVVAGSVVIERVFGIHGMGVLAFEAIGTRDYPVVMGVATVMAAVTLVSMLLTDLAAAWVDPRIRLPGSGAR
ncbi:MAG: ABC transporter permease [Myxococcaceae bacterium]|nr:ABC transporter permease [Myxococcaceae bacterium]